MSYPAEPLREHPSTYIVQDRSNQEEMARLEVQDTMLTAGMGGVLPEITDPGSLRHVLDVGCGTGGWLISTAKRYPTIKKLFGGDISDKILAYARHQAEEQHLDDRVRFQSMDALRVLEYPDSSFDLVNQRAGVSWLRTWDWKKILTEYRRVLRPGGIVRITESDAVIESTSPALTKLGEMSLDIFYHSGRLFRPERDGLTGELVRLLSQHGFEHIQTRVHTLILQAGTIEGEQFAKDMEIGYRVALPFFQRWGGVPSDYQEIYQQAIKEIRATDFVATWQLLTAWAIKSRSGDL